MINELQSLVKALEAGNYDAAPSTLVQGSALQIEDLSPVMNNVTYDDSHIKLQKMIKTEACKSTLAQFDRQLSYGIFGGSAQLEGNVGQEETSDFVRITVPMAFYSHTRRNTLASNMVATVDGKTSDTRAAEDAAKKLAADIEFDCFRGLADFSNGGVFDGNPLAVPALPNMHGVDLQVRQSDGQANARDRMFAEYGSDDSVVVNGGGTLTQDNIEDVALRSNLNFGSPDKFVTDPVVLAQYNKISFGKERIILAGAPQDATSADLKRQWVSGGTVNLESSQFLRGKAKPQAPRANGPASPSSVAGVAAAGGTLAAGDYWYHVTAVNENGESVRTAVAAAISVAANEKVTLTITHGSGVFRHFNVYRSAPGGSLDSARFIGRVKKTDNSATTAFVDLGNKSPGFVTGFLIQGDTMVMKELSPYSRIKLAVTDLSTPEAHFRFCTLAMPQPRKNVLLDNLTGTF